MIILNLLTFAIADGVVLKIVDLLNNGVWSQVSQWKVCEENIDDIKVKQVFFVFDYLRQKPVTIACYLFMSLLTILNVKQ